MNKIILVIGIIVVLIILSKPTPKLARPQIGSPETLKKTGDVWDCSADSIHDICWADEEIGTGDCENCKAWVEISFEGEGLWGYCDMGGYYGYYRTEYVIDWFGWGDKIYYLESDTPSNLGCDSIGCHDTSGQLHEEDDPFIWNTPRQVKKYLYFGAWDDDDGCCGEQILWTSAYGYYKFESATDPTWPWYILGCCKDSDCPKSGNCIREGDWSQWHCETCECDVDDIRLCCDGCHTIPDCTPCECTDEPCCDGCEYIAGCNPYDIFLEYKNTYLAYGSFESFIELANKWVI